MHTNSLIYVLIILLAAIPFLMGKYIEFNSPGAFDSGAYVYSAKHVLDGAIIGVDERPSARLGTLLVNMLGVHLFGFNETGPMVMQTLLQLAALLLTFIAINRLFGTLPAAVAVIIASTYLSAPLIAKFGNVKEQYMIACMMLGISFFVLYQQNRKWTCGLLAAVFISWAPLFKETGTSALAAIGLFVLIQPILGNTSFRQTRRELLLLLTGFIIALTPLYLWLEIADHRGMRPYASVFRPIISAMQSTPANMEKDPNPKEGTHGDIEHAKGKHHFLERIFPSYVTGSWKTLEPEQRKQVLGRVFRYYRLLILPIGLALASLSARLIRLFINGYSKLPRLEPKKYERFVLLFSLWWVLDMSLVWVSPRSYEQYYLPLNASGAMLGGYIVALYADHTASRSKKAPWIAVGLLGLVIMLILSWPIFFGIERSPHTNKNYEKKQRGYVQKLSVAHNRRTSKHKDTWQMVAQYIRTHSQPTDRIYVWGWYPGIYVDAQRLGAATAPGISTMHTMAPKELTREVSRILEDFAKRAPKFIVDTRKRHFPWNRPPLELWPRTRQGFLPPDRKEVVEGYDQLYSDWLTENLGAAEAFRYKAMKPFRQYVMENFRIVQTYGQHVLFERGSPGMSR